MAVERGLMAVERANVCISIFMLRSMIHMGPKSWQYRHGGCELISPKCRMYASLNRVDIGSDNGLSPIRRQAII